MLLWKQGDPLEIHWHRTGEKFRADDGATIRRWSKNRYDPESQFEHTEDRYEVVRERVTIANEYHVRSPATREYIQQQAHYLYIKAGFVDVCI
jgi:hypothetical protein